MHLLGAVARGVVGTLIISTVVACSGAAPTPSEEPSSAPTIGESTASVPANPSESSATVIMDPSDLKIAYFSAGEGNTYLQANIDGLQETVAKIGATADIFDGKFSAQTQFDQIQTALDSGKYNALIVEPNDGNQLCKILTQDAAAKGILVVAATGALCGRDTQPGDGVWQPGTVAYVGGQTAGVYESWVARVMSDSPSGANVAVITGPTVNANTTNVDNALKQMTADPKFKIVAEQATDYTTPQAYAAAQSILQANPSLDIIMSNYSGLTQGVVKAVKDAGRLGQIKIYDVGGNAWSLDAIRNGELTLTVYLVPKDEISAAVLALRDYVGGTPGPHFVDMSKWPGLPGTNLVDKSNVAKFTAQY